MGVCVCVCVCAMKERALLCPDIGQLRRLEEFLAFSLAIHPESERARVRECESAKLWMWAVSARGLDEMLFRAYRLLA